MARLPRVVGVVHLPPLPGSARGGPAASMRDVLAAARRDAAAYAEGGADALIVENFGDVPFVKERVGAHVVAAMTLAVAAVREETGLPVGVNVLRNDVLSAVSIAAMAGGSFVRANVYVGATVTDQGLIEGRAEEVQALIRRLGADVAVWADVDVKHAAPLAPRPLGELAEDAVERGLAGAVIVTGRATGQPAADADLRAVRAAVPHTPLYVGSGVTAETVSALLRIADGVIVGTASKMDGIVTNPVSVERVREIVAAARAGAE
ncbi:MAG TPA: BtpA/SgcQ family protein [Thermomicrobiales bacterium]